MKKFLILNVMALALVAMTQQQADAWCNVKFGAGVNLNWQGGDNSFMWGLYRSGQVPHAGPGIPPGYPGGVPGYPGAAPGYPGGYPGYPGPGLGMSFPFGEFGAQGAQQFAPQAAAQMPPATAHAPNLLPQQVNQQATWLNNSHYQPVGYTYPSYNYYQMPTAPYQYGYPTYWYGY